LGNKGAEWFTWPLAVCSPAAALALHCLTLHGYEDYCPRLRELRVLRGRRAEVLLLARIRRPPATIPDDLQLLNLLRLRPQFVVKTAIGAF
jgi:hypothetical protein